MTRLTRMWRISSGISSWTPENMAASIKLCLLCRTANKQPRVPGPKKSLGTAIYPDGAPWKTCIPFLHIRPKRSVHPQPGPPLFFGFFWGGKPKLNLYQESVSGQSPRVLDLIHPPFAQRVNRLAKRIDQSEPTRFSPHGMTRTKSRLSDLIMDQTVLVEFCRDR